MPGPTTSLLPATLEWRWKPFAALTAREVYDMLAARAAVFVLEQNCLYGDVDGLDVDAWHLFAYGERGEKKQENPQENRHELAGYLRVLLPGATDPAVRDLCIGRVLTTAGFRGQGLGNALLARALAHVGGQWPGVAIRLHAQAHLQPFYGAFGFRPISDIHDEDGIAHVWMRSG